MIENNTSSTMQAIDRLFEKHDDIAKPSQALAQCGLTAERVRTLLGTKPTKYDAIRNRNAPHEGFSLRLLVRGLLKQNRGVALTAKDIAGELDSNSYAIGNMLRILAEEHPEVTRERGPNCTLWSWRRQPRDYAQVANRDCEARMAEMTAPKTEKD